jgi:PAS domain S-box-containing protein
MGNNQDDYGVDNEAFREQALRTSELSYRRLFESAQDGILILDADTGRITDANPFLIKLLDFSRDEMVGKTVGELSPFKDIVSNQAMLERLQMDGYVRYENLPLETRSGRRIAVEFVSNVYQAGDKRVIQCNIRDITERRRMQTVLNHFKSIVESSDDAIIGKDLDGIITSWNPGAEKAFGYSPPEAIGKSMLMLIPPGRANEEPEILGRIMRGENVDHFETVRVCKDGKLIDISATISPLKDGSGKIIGASKIARDITERKQAQEKISQLNIELEQRVIQRTAELEAANQELEAFGYSVSHDLRAPLRAVNGFAGIVLQDFSSQLPEEGKRYLEQIRNGGERMEALIDGLLAFSHLSRQFVNQQVVDTMKLVQNVLDESQTQWEGCGLEIKTGELPVSHGDPVLLKQVWVNLVSNAIKYTRGREPGIIEIGCIHENGENVYFIRDNGAGFDMQYANKLFGVFQRLHGADEFEGTGVGLAIVQRIIHRHGGRVWAQAEVNRGATFYFTLEGKNKL